MPFSSTHKKIVKMMIFPLLRGRSLAIHAPVRQRERSVAIHRG